MTLKKLIKQSMLCLTMAVIGQIAFAQSNVITGTAIDENDEPLIAVSVKAENGKAVSTNMEGPSRAPTPTATPTSLTSKVINTFLTLLSPLFSFYSFLYTDTP